jgi:hypothetical protein
MPIVDWNICDVGGVAVLTLSRSLFYMTTPKFPNFSQRLLLWLSSAQTPEAKKVADPADYQNQGIVPLTVNPEHRPELILYAQTAQGLLAQRDPDALRRFILDSDCEAEQNFRQGLLFAMASTRLAKWPHSGLPHTAPFRPRIVQAGLYALPVVFCMEQSVRIRSSFNFDSRRSTGLKAELTLAFAEGLNLPPGDVRIQDTVAVQYLAGVSPLSLQASMVNRLKNTSNPASNCSPSDEALSSLLPAGVQEFIAVGRDSPAAFVVMAIVAWDTDRNPPVFTDPLKLASQRMQALLQALFTHALPAADPNVTTCSPALVHSEVRVGQIQPLHEAMTQAQWMQMAWTAERARRTGCSFCLEHHHEQEMTKWTASLTDDSGDVVTQVSYEYLSFWRPIQHARTIVEKVSIAQGTGRMSIDPLQDPLPH